MSEPFDRAVIQTYEGLIGEVLGRAIDFEAKYRVSLDTIASLKKMVEELRGRLEENTSQAEDMQALVVEIEAAKIREKDLSERNSELSLTREELMAKVAKLERQVNGKYGKAKTQRSRG